MGPREGSLGGSAARFRCVWGGSRHEVCRNFALVYAAPHFCVATTGHGAKYSVCWWCSNDDMDCRCYAASVSVCTELLQAADNLKNRD